MNMEYNTGRNKLVIPEYGRHIQKLIEYAVDVKDVEERNKLARAIVDVMGQLNPHLRDITDFKHKLWDHLFIISNFKLEVDSPYQKPDQHTFRVKPDRIAYPSGKIRYRHYGKTLEKVIEELVKMEDGTLKDQVAVNVANFMKLLYVNWNKDSVTDEVIKSQLNEMSGGKIVIPEDVKFVNPPEVHTRTNTRKGSGRKGRSRGSNGRGHRKN
jgi:hypothetical protein